MERAEATGLSASVAGHVVLLLLLTLGLANIARTSPPSPAIEVSFVDEVGLTSAAPVPTVEPPMQGMAPETGPIEDAVTDPDPAPPQPDAPPAPSPAPAVTRQAQPQPRRAAPQRPSNPSPARPRERTRRSLIGDDLLKGIGRDPSPSRSTRSPATMTGEARASINAAIRRALVPCERQPLPAPEAAAIRVDVRVSLNRDGALAGAEVARVLNDNPALSQYERRMQDLALAIVRSCTPIRGLPADLYDVPRGWRQFTYQFDPR